MNTLRCVVSLALLAAVTAPSSQAQTNIFPASGNVGIGTTTPVNSLEVVGGRTLLGDGSNSGWLFAGSSGGLTAFHVGSKTNVPLAFFTNSSGPRMTITTDGNVGIGTTNPATPLQITTAYYAFTDTPMQSWTPSIGGYGLSLSNYNSTSGIDYRFTQLNGGASYPVLTFQNGNVGIGTTTPSCKVDITGLLRVTDPGVGPWPASGSGTEVAYRNGIGFLLAYDRTASAYLPVRIEGASISINGASGGNVGIGTTTPTEKLAVNGRIRAKEVIVETNWSDFVFDPGYRLTPLSEVERQIKSDRHLPGIPSAQDVAEGGVSLGDMQARLLQKIEELTLHLIQQEKQLDEQRTQIERQNQLIRHLEDETHSRTSE